LSNDRIEKKILLHASRARVWRALVDSHEFGRWFGVRFDGPFTPGQPITGALVGTEVNPEIAELQKQHAGVPFNITVDRIEPERLFSFRWHPHANEKGVDYSAESMTLITFTLEETREGVLLTVVESGFDKIPLARRAQAFRGNEGGWEIMVKIFGEYIARES
jgi:uncharacterized protein YndB with AHSA1/START domain